MDFDFYLIHNLFIYRNDKIEIFEYDRIKKRGLLFEKRVNTAKFLVYANNLWYIPNYIRQDYIAKIDMSNVLKIESQMITVPPPSV